jgi:hypothetical protein
MSSARIAPTRTSSKVLHGQEGNCAAKFMLGLLGREELWFFTAIGTNSQRPNAVKNQSSSQ